MWWLWSGWEGVCGGGGVGEICMVVSVCVMVCGGGVVFVCVWWFVVVSGGGG